MKPSPLVLDYIQRCLTYDPMTGIVYRKGKPIGTPRKGTKGTHMTMQLNLDTSYQGCRLSYTTYTHQVAWYLYYGEWPTQFLDHIDGNGSNNALTNLRLATYTENSRNSRKRKSRATSQYKGVMCRDSRYRAFITHEGKQLSLGTYSTEEDAALAYNTKATQLFGQYACLNVLTVKAKQLVVA